MPRRCGPARMALLQRHARADGGHTDDGKLQVAAYADDTLGVFFGVTL
jgi:hypothetical protein